MADVVPLLQIDHRKMVKVLDVIQEQAINMGRQAPVNYRLLESIFAYLSGYPDQCHHPKEDLVYRKLLHRCPDLADSLKDLVKEHETLAYLTRGVARAIAESHQDSPGATDRLRGQLQEFLDLYRHHMRVEEQHFFPAALQRLSPNDFAEIDFTLFDQPDPVFDREAEERFTELREEITRLGVIEATSRASHREAALLAGFRDIASFNDAMEQSGEPVRLIRSSGEGYELQHHGSALVHIPACSEPRAAWCAYFYWKAVTGRALA